MFARGNAEAGSTEGRRRFSPRAYVGSVWGDARASLWRVWRCRAALVAIVVFLVPWLSLVYFRQDWAWTESFGEVVLTVLAFWWMSRSGAAAGTEIKYPLLESILAIGLVLFWVEWRIGICADMFPFLPPNFSCYQSTDYDVIPKLVENILVPFVILFGLGYRWRAMGINWSWRAWLIALPALIAAAAAGLYLHQKDPLSFGKGIVDFFFGAGLPEEFLFRALLLSRLEAWLKNPGWAILGAAAIFGLAHVPIDYLVFTRNNWRETWLTALTFQMGFGFAFAFAYQRMRNIWPLALLHAMVDALG